MRWSFLVGLLVLAATGSANASFIANGSFETTGPGGGGSAGGTFVYVAGQHDTEIAGWTLSGTGDVYIHRSPDVGNAHSFPLNFPQHGDQYLDLSGGIGGGSGGLHATIYQDFATTALQEYELSFFTAASFLPLQTINVRLDGAAALLNETLTASAPEDGLLVWTEQRFRFVADSSMTRLSFQDLSSSDDNVSFVDNVAVNVVPAAVPEPSSSLMLLIGLPIVAVKARRKRRAAAECRANETVVL